jgi:hypothetical protein
VFRNAAIEKYLEGDLLAELPGVLPMVADDLI